jgi:hypothetical protein
MWIFNFPRRCLRLYVLFGERCEEKTKAEENELLQGLIDDDENEKEMRVRNTRRASFDDNLERAMGRSICFDPNFSPLRVKQRSRTKSSVFVSELQ